MWKFDGDMFRQARVAKRLTQSELGQKVGLSSASVCRIERGDRAPSEKEIEDLTIALEMTAGSNSRVARNMRPAVSRMIGTNQRLRVEITLEQLNELASASEQGELGITNSVAKPKPIVIYVPLEGMTIESRGVQEEPEDESRGEYPREQ